jgi:hypothetical protein
MSVVVAGTTATSETNFPIHFDFCKFFWEGYVDFNYIDLKRLDNTVNKWNKK